MNPARDVADERAGLPEAVASLLEWLREADRFSAGWVAAVDEVLRLARDSPSRAENIEPTS